jgi:hypothetical protein
MRVKDADQIQGLGLDPFQRPELLVRIHHESHGTLRLIPHKDHFLHPIVFPGKQTTCLERRVCFDMKNHFIYLRWLEG